MNHLFHLSLIYLLLGFTPLSATAFDDANRQYQAEDFAGSAASYERLLSSEGPRAAVYYNLGNSYLSLKRYGFAILAYERARMLTPRDPDLLTNLALARKAVGSPEQLSTNPNLEVVLRYFSRDEWSWLVAGSALILGAVTLVGGWFRLPRRFFQCLVSSAGAAGFLIVVGFVVLYLRRGESARGVILSEMAAIRLSPFEKAESIGTPGLGKMVHLGLKSGDFQYVDLPGGNLQGWLASKDVAAIVPE